MTIPALILAVASTLSAAPPTPRDGAKPPVKEQLEASAERIKELKKERIAALKEQIETLNSILPRPALAGWDRSGELLEARLLLLQAELEVTEEGADRIALYRGAVESLKQYEEAAQREVDRARGTRAAVLRIKARRLEVEIQLEQAEAKWAKPAAPQPPPPKMVPPRRPE
jgi:hypothetical protein